MERVFLGHTQVVLALVAELNADEKISARPSEKEKKRYIYTLTNRLKPLSFAFFHYLKKISMRGRKMRVDGGTRVVEGDRLASLK